MALLPTPRCEGVGERIAGIGLEHQPEQTQRLLIVFRGFGKRRWYRATDQIIDVLARLRLAPGALDLGAAQHRTDRADQTFGDLVLQIERVFERAVEALVPQMFSARHLDKLAADANPIAGLSETPLDHIAEASRHPSPRFSAPPPPPKAPPGRRGGFFKIPPPPFEIKVVWGGDHR